ncbi:hypothetical protein GCM10023350_29890 [Nocardioides endophyticus]|uniref:Glutamine amidotransferase domain-containing protein n=1 Tax=Nocardioides endophyticus TaxID=1353775 RepID=A0ABP8Z0P8_9ACTN
MANNTTVLVLQHIDCEPPATYEDLVLDSGLAIHRVELDEGEPLPGHVDFAAMVVMGGPMGAMDDSRHRWLQEERSFINRAVMAGVPYWGVCLGAQLLAASLGGTVYTGPTPEIGAFRISRTSESNDDPVFGRLPAEFDVFQWHSDTFTLPDGAVRLAGSATYENQAFCLGSAYGVQFHVEVNATLAARWAGVEAYQQSLRQVHGEDGAERVMKELVNGERNNRAIATTIFGEWLGRFVLHG